MEDKECKIMICPKEKCTGCEACYCVCPKNAITMQEDDYGNIYPIIDNNKCIHLFEYSSNENVSFNINYEQIYSITILN